MQLDVKSLSLVGARQAEKTLALQSAPYWEEIFAEEDPWKYNTSAYEAWKLEQMLSLLPAGPIGHALEVGCAEGHVTERLAPHVERLTACDISWTAIERARTRCAACSNITFEVGNVTDYALPDDLDLILCSEVLYYLPLDDLLALAARFAESLRPGGHILLIHGNIVTDDRDNTGFDWGHDFGARTIGQVFIGLAGVVLVQELSTPLFTVHLFRRAEAGRDPVQRNVPLPPDLQLLPELEKTILWDGVALTRAEAAAQEVAVEVPILMYHSIADDGPQELALYRIATSTFVEQLRYLRRHGYHSITLDEWANSIVTKTPLHGRPVIITFDDAYTDFLERAWPALERADFTATLFVVTGKAGGVADWDQHSGRPLKLLGWKELRTLAGQGVTIGSHSVTHPDFLKLPLDHVMAEGERARAILQTRMGQDVVAIAFPWGRSNLDVRAVLSRCGYQIGLTTRPGFSTLDDDLMDLPRVEISGDMDIEDFALALRPTMPMSLPAAPGVSDETLAIAEIPPPMTTLGLPVADDDVEPVGFINRPGSSPDTADAVLAPAVAVPEAEAASELDEPEPVGFTAAGPGQASHEQDAEPTLIGQAYEERSILDGQHHTMPLHPQHARAFAARLDALIGEFVRLQGQLLAATSAADSLQNRLARLFALPVTGTVARPVQPGAEISPGIALSFPPTMAVMLRIDPKTSHAVSPDGYLNTIGLDCTGSSSSLGIEIELEWRDVSMAQRFQFCFYGRATQTVTCHAAIRFPSAGSTSLQSVLTSFVLHADDRNAVVSGEVEVPDFIELDISKKSVLVLYFDTVGDLSLELQYMNLYFA